MSKQILLPTLEDVGDAALKASITNPQEAKRYSDVERRAIRRMLNRTSGETMVERRFSYWRWVWVDPVPPTSTEWLFRSHYLRNGWDLVPRDTDPPVVRCENDVKMLLVDNTLPRGVRDGGLRWLERFEKDGWGFLRDTDPGYQKLGHRWRMRLKMRELRARRKLELDEFCDLKDVMIESGLKWDEEMARVEELNLIALQVRVTGRGAKKDPRRELFN